MRAVLVLLLSLPTLSFASSNAVKVLSLDSANSKITVARDVIPKIKREFNVKAKIQIDCRLSGYRVHSVKTRGGDYITLGSNRSSVILRDHLVTYEGLTDQHINDALQVCIKEVASGRLPARHTVTVKHRISAKCEKVKRPNKGNMKTIASALYSLRLPVDCTDLYNNTN